MPLKAVLFDLDDTLFDNLHSSRCALAALQDDFACLREITLDALERQYSGLLDGYHDRVLRGELTLDQARLARFTDLLRRFDGGISPAQVERVGARYRQAYYASSRTVDGAVALLERLRAGGLRIALVTNHTVDEQMGKLRRCGLTDLIDVLAISEAVGAAKPDPRIFAFTLEQLGCAADEVVMIGDSWSADIVGARAVGIRALWLNRRDEVCPDPALAVEIRTLDAVMPHLPLV